MSVELNLCIKEGQSFVKLFDYLKNNSSDGILTFTPQGVRYSELISGIDNPKKTTTLDIKNVFEIPANKLNIYTYKLKESEYSVCFTIKTLLLKIKGSLKKDQIYMYKMDNDPYIYIRIVHPDDTDPDNGSSASVAFFKPLNMQSRETFEYPASYRGEDTPNCTISPKKFKKDCTPISPTGYKMVKLICYYNRIEIRAISVDDSDGHILEYGSASRTPKVDIDVGKLTFDLDKIYTDDNLMISPVKVNIIEDDNPLMISIPTGAFKNLVKLTQLSSELIRLYFENGYLKILTCVGTYGIIRTYIKDN